MAVKLHRCPVMFAKYEGHPCWRVQKALDEAGVNYEVVKEKYFGSRGETVQRTGQRGLPWIEFEDGAVYRAESKEMAERIRAGKLQSGSTP
jgi:glutaredoxin